MAIHDTFALMALSAVIAFAFAAWIFSPHLQRDIHLYRKANKELREESVLKDTTIKALQDRIINAERAVIEYKQGLTRQISMLSFLRDCPFADGISGTGGR